MSQSTEPITAPGVGVFAGRRASIGDATESIDVARELRNLIIDVEGRNRRVESLSSVAYAHNRADFAIQLHVKSDLFPAGRTRTYRISVEEL